MIEFPARMRKSGGSFYILVPGQYIKDGHISLHKEYTVRLDEEKSGSDNHSQERE